MKRMIMLLLCCALFVPAQDKGITAEQVLQKVKANFDAVKDYTVQLSGKLDLERLRMPQMKVKLYFKQPNKFKTESKGTSMLPKNILDLNPSDLLSKFDASLLGKEEIEGRPYYKLRLVTKPVKGKPVRESFIWVDAVQWTITRLEAYPSEGRKIEVDITSMVVDGRYILPERITAKFDFSQDADSSGDRIYSPNRVPRKGSAELIYSDYQVNTGLSDALFEKNEEKEEK